MLRAYRVSIDAEEAIVIARNFTQAVAATKSWLHEEDEDDEEATDTDPDSVEEIGPRVVIAGPIMGYLPARWDKGSWDSFTDGLWNEQFPSPRPGTLDAISKLHEEPGRLRQFLEVYPHADLSRLCTALEDATSRENVWELWAANEEGALDGFSEGPGEDPDAPEPLDIDASHVVPAEG